MTILITGGTGFLGSYFTRYALHEGGEERVVVLDRYVDRGRIADVLDRVTLIEGDVADPETVRRAIEENGVDRVAHFAFILGSPTPGQMLNYVKVQSLGTANVFECARVADVRRVLFASSVAAYGKQDVEWLAEDLIPNPQNPYGSAKLWGEALAKHYTSELELEVVSVRFGSTYGLGRAWRGSYSSGMLSLPQQVHYMARVEDAVRGRPIVLPRGDAVADWTYAADAAQAAWRALTAEHLPHHLYNVGSERLPIADYTQALRELLPKAEITVSDDEGLGNPHQPLDATRLREELGFQPKYELKSGLEDYIKRIRILDEYNSSSS